MPSATFWKMLMSSRTTGGEQLEVFKRTAHLLGCDEDETAFEERLQKIAKGKPGPADKKAPPKAK